MFDFIGKRKWFFILSILIMFAGIAGLLINGIQLDIQFEGGTLMQIEMNDGDFETSRAEEVFYEAVNKTATAQKLQTINAEDNQTIYLLQLRIASSETLTDEERTEAVDALRKEFNIGFDAGIEMQSVEPFIGRELRNKGAIAALYASLLIILYIWWRFRVMNLSAAITAVISLFHDLMVMFTFYVIFKFPLNESFIAAILTILGYSINGTIVIYDRIRENSKLLRKASTAELVNTSINQTMGRTVNTAVTTLLCVLAVYIFAYYYNIQSIKEFILPLIIGIISGVYSSVFISGPLWVLWKERQQHKVVEKRA